MIYPVVVCIVAVIVTIVMLVKVIPSYEDMFSQIGGADLPWITKVLCGNLSHGYYQNYWFIIIPVIVVAAAIGIRIFRQEQIPESMYLARLL